MTSASNNGGEGAASTVAGRAGVGPLDGGLGRGGSGAASTAASGRAALRQGGGRAGAAALGSGRGRGGLSERRRMSPRVRGLALKHLIPVG